MPSPKNPSPVPDLDLSLRRPPCQISNFGQPAQLRTLHDLVFYSISKHATKPALSSRKIISETTEITVLRELNEKQKVIKKGAHGPERVYGKTSMQTATSVGFGEWETLRYQDVGERLILLARYLVALRQTHKLEHGDENVKMCFFGRSSMEWFTLSLAAHFAGISVVGLLLPLGKHHLTKALAETQPIIVFTDASLLEALQTSLFECPATKLVIYSEASLADESMKQAKRELEVLSKYFSKIEFLSYDEIAERGEKLMKSGSEGWIPEVDSEGYEDKLWGILYPRSLNEEVEFRGLVLTNGNIVSAVTAIAAQLKGDLKPDDSYLAYLPPALIIELTLIYTFFLSGVCIGFGTQGEKYISPSPFSRICFGHTGDLHSFAPSIFFAILPTWTIFHERLLQELTKPFYDDDDKREKFWENVKRKWRLLKSTPPPLMKATRAAIARFEKLGGIKEVREKFFGPRVRWCGVTCALMNEEHAALLGAVFGGFWGRMVKLWTLLPIATIVTFQSPNHPSPTSIGPVLTSLGVKLTTCQRLSARSYRGRILICGASLAHKGYFKDRNPVPVDWLETPLICDYNSDTRELTPVHTTTSLEGRFLGEFIPAFSLEKVYEAAGASLGVEKIRVSWVWGEIEPRATVTVREGEEEWRELLRRAVSRSEEKRKGSLGGPVEELEERVRLEIVNELKAVLNERAKKSGVVTFEMLGTVAVVVLKKDDEKLQLKEGWRSVEAMLGMKTDKEEGLF